MRLAEQREALQCSSRATTPPSRSDDLYETQFPTDEDTFAQNFEKRQEVNDLDETPVWLVGNHCSIADLSFLTWANVADRIGIDLETEFPVYPFARP